MHLVENDEQLISDVAEFGGGHAIHNGIERHGWAFLHEEIPDAFLPVPSIDDDIGKGSVMQNAWGMNGKPSMDEL